MMSKSWHHTAEARARIGAASKLRGSAGIALAASNAAIRNRRLSDDHKKKVSEGLKLAWAEGRIKPRQKLFTAEEIRIRRNIANRAKYAANRELILAKQREWHAANPERKKQIARDYVERNRDRLNAKQREKNKDLKRKEFMRNYAPKHRALNPDKYRMYSENRRSRQLGADGYHTDEQWRNKVANYFGRCAYCQKEGVLTRDHDIPLARGGSNNIDNIVPACSPCNSAKGTLTGAEYRQRLAGIGQSMDARWSKQLDEARALWRGFQRNAK